MTTKIEERIITFLIKKIRMTREEWCEMVNDELKKINTYQGKTDNEIIVEALYHYLWEEEEELQNMYEHEGKENDRTTE